MIFRGLGQRIALAEQAQYDPDVVVLYQINGWQDQPTQMSYAEKCTQPYMKKKREAYLASHPGENEAPYGIMLQDNLRSQCLDSFVSYMEEHCHMLCHMGEKEESTHMWQAVDRGIGKILKLLYEQEQVCVCVCFCVSLRNVFMFVRVFISSGRLDYGVS